MRSRWRACVLLLALLPAAPALGQRLAREAATSIVGRVCEDRGRDGRCDPGDPAVPGVVVRTLRGGLVRSDTRGRFRMPVVGARSFARDGAGRIRPRLVHLYLFVDGRSLGLSAGEAQGQWVDLLPGATLSVDFALPVQRPAAGRAPRSGRDSGTLPRAARAGEGLLLRVPVEVQAGHKLLHAGAPLPTDAKGRAFVPLPLSGRETFASFLDRSSDGRVRVMSVRGLRVPWENGANLLVHRPAQTLLTVDLPAGPVTPGRLRVRVQGKAGTTFAFEHEAPDAPGVPEALGEDQRNTDVHRISGAGEEEIWLEIAQGPVRLWVQPEGEPRREVQLPLDVDPALLRTLHLSADLRAGIGDGLFGEGRVDLFGETPLLGGRLGGGLRLSDARLIALAERGRPLALGAGPIYARVPDPEVFGIAFGDDARYVDENPGDATLWGGWVGEAGRVGLFPSRTPLSGAEVGRFDRATYGPEVTLSTTLAATRLELSAAADAWGLPLMEDPEVLPGHAELLATGGSFYLLPHREIAEGSERIFVEWLDPGSGLPLDRRLLRRGRDYEIDTTSGRILLSSPLGLFGVRPAARLGEQSLGAPAQLVVDYHYRPAPGQGAGYAAGGARVSVSRPGFGVGLQAAGINAGRYGLLAADLDLAPLEGVSLSASVARSAGDPMLGRGRQRSLDGGARFEALPGPLPAQTGALAFAARAQVGDEGWPFRLSAWGALREAGYADSASQASRRTRGAAADRAAGARLDVGDAGLGLLAEAGLAEDARGASASAHLRAVARRGAFGLALEGGFERVSREDPAGGAARSSGSRGSAGLEFSYRVSDDLEVLARHLQGVVREGSGPASEDPTFTSLGVRTEVPGLGRLQAFGGVHPDGRPGLRVAWLAEQAGRSRYANFGTETDGPWDGQGQAARASVVGGQQIVDARTDLFAESRLQTTGDGPVSGTENTLLSGTAVGGRLGRGPLSLTATYERAARPGASSGQLRDGLFLRVGYLSERVSISAFGENTRAYARDPSLGFARRSAGGASARLTPTDAITLALRGLAVHTEGAGVLPGVGSAGEVPLSLEGSADLVYRPPTGVLSLGLLHYGVAADPRPGPAGLWHRLHSARVALQLGRGAGPTLTFAGVLVVDEARRPSTADAPAARALVGTLRLAWPLFDRIEPVLEIGGRRLWGAGETQFAPTVRVELLAVFGALRVGLGAAISGFTGEGTEPVTAEPAAPRIYLVLRGAR